MSRVPHPCDAVVDASAIVDFLLQPARDAPLSRMLGQRDIDLHAPMLCELEVVAGVRRALLRGRLSGTASAHGIVQDLVDLPLELYPHQPILSRTLDLYENFTTYDAAYVALAEALGVPLLTSDAKLAAATRTHTNVEVLTA